MMIDDNSEYTAKCPNLPPAEPEPVPDAPHILIVEEQPEVGEMLRWMLQLAGYRTTVCAERSAALTWREQAMQADSPVVMLLDLSLPCATEAAGFLSSLRVKWQEAGTAVPPIIVLTTSPRVRAELEIKESVIQKPFHVHDLLALIQGACSCKR